MFNGIKGNNPVKRQIKASMNWGTFILHGNFLFCSNISGSFPIKAEFTNFRNDASVTADIKIEIIPDIINTILINKKTSDCFADHIEDSKIRSLDTKPLKGGTPAMESEPIRAVIPARGITFINPSTLFKSVVFVL